MIDWIGKSVLSPEGWHLFAVSVTSGLMMIIGACTCWGVVRLFGFLHRQGGTWLVGGYCLAVWIACSRGLEMLQSVLNDQALAN